MNPELPEPTPEIAQILELKVDMGFKRGVVWPPKTRIFTFAGLFRYLGYLAMFLGVAATLAFALVTNLEETTVLCSIQLLVGFPLVLLLGVVVVGFFALLVHWREVVWTLEQPPATPFQITSTDITLGDECISWSRVLVKTVKLQEDASAHLSFALRDGTPLGVFASLEHRDALVWLRDVIVHHAQRSDGSGSSVPEELHALRGQSGESDLP